MNTHPTLCLDLLIHIGTFMNPEENVDWCYTYNERMYLAGALRDKDLLQFYLKSCYTMHVRVLPWQRTYHSLGYYGVKVVHGTKGHVELQLVVDTWKC